MPEFILNEGGKVALSFADLPLFTRGYIEAAFFTSNAPGVCCDEWDSSPEVKADLEAGRLDGTVPADAGFSSLSPAALVRIIGECGAFAGEAMVSLKEACDRDGYSEEQAGRDFWLTRNGHGAGYWDREALTGPEGDDLGDKLSEIARGYGESNLYYENGETGVE